MATNTSRYVKSLYGCDGPLLVPGYFQAGGTQAVKMGELIERTVTIGGVAYTGWVPMDADYDMTAADDAAAVAAVEVKSGDDAGYRPFICPRPGDVFRYDLLSTDDQNPSLGAAVYWSSSERVTTTAGSHIIGNIAGWQHYPLMQGFQSDDASVDRGTTIRSVDGGEVWITFQPSNTPYGAIQTT